MLRIKYERQLRGWSQVALAYHASMSVADVSRIESGRLRPYPSQLEKLAAVLGVSRELLLQDVAGESSLDAQRGTAEPAPAA